MDPHPASSADKDNSDQLQNVTLNSCPTPNLISLDALSINGNSSKDLIDEDEDYFSDCGRVEKNEIYGRYVVASRLIEAGELVLEESPLNVSPYGPTDRLPYCLACFKDLAFSEKCSACRWPICSNDGLCQKSPLHSKECEIFGERNLRPKSLKIEYEAIEVLRCLYLSETNEKAWEKILSFESHTESRRECAKTKEATRLIDHFIRNKCGIEKFSPQIIEKVTGILAVNTFFAHRDTNKYGSLLFGKATMFSHECDPNTKRTITYSTDFPNLFKIEVVANRQIKEGEMISIHYNTLSTESVKMRRERLKEYFYFDCACKLCAKQLAEEAQNETVID